MSAVVGGETLRQRVIRAGGWTLFGHMSCQVLRFCSNLILTRLLFPEAFGLMAIVQAVLSGVVLLTDVGIAQSIVTSKSGDQERYANTAWTIQIIKGTLIAGVLLLAAGPVAQYYRQPILADLLPMAALVAFLGGFESTKVALSGRNVDTHRLTLIDVGTLIVNIVTSTILAWINPTPWALAWGYLVSECVKVVAGHVFLKGPSNRLTWDSSVARGILSFGLWVMLSSSLTFLGGEGNRLIWGSLLDVRLLGLLGLATTMNLVVWQAAKQLSGRVLFPAYSEVFRNNPSRFSKVVEQGRLVQIAPTWCVSLVLAFGAPAIFSVLYDHRYWTAATILQILALGMMVDVLNGSFSGVLWAMRRVSVSTGLQVAMLCCQIGGMLVGYWVAGKHGAIIGFASAGWVLYPLHAFVYARLGLWHPRIDIPVLVVSSLCVVALIHFGDWSALEALR